MKFVEFKFRVVVLLPLIVGFALLPAYGVSPISYQTAAFWKMEQEVRLNDYRNKIQSEIGVVDLVLGQNDTADLPTLTADGDGYGGIGKALVFTGTDGAYSNDFRASDNYNISIEFCFKTPDVAEQQTLLIMSNHLEFRLSNGELIFYVFAGTSGSVVGSVRDGVSANVWNYVKAIAKDGEISLQVNDSEPATASDVSLTPNNNRLVLGSRHDFAARFYTGLIDEIHIKNFDAAEPLHNWREPYEDNLSLHGLWKMDKIEDVEGETYIFDHDPNNLLRPYNNLKLVAGAQGKPQLVVPDTFPNGDTSFDKCVKLKGWGDYLVAESIQKDLGIVKNNLRVECWVKLEEPTTGTGNIYTVFSHNNGYKLYLRDRSDVSLPRFELRIADDAPSATTDFITYTLEDPNQQWYHLAAEFTDTEFKLYLNNALVNSKSLPGTGVLRTPTYYFKVGAEPGGANAFKGYIDEVRISPISIECGAYGYPEADLNKDCYVNIEDLQIMLENWLLQY